MIDAKGFMPLPKNGAELLLEVAASGTREVDSWLPSTCPSASGPSSLARRG